MRISPLDHLTNGVDHVAVIDRGRSYRAREVASVVRLALDALDRLAGRSSTALLRGVALVARPTFSSVALIHALIEREIPFLPLDPRLPEAERDRLLSEMSLPLLSGGWLGGEKLDLEGGDRAAKVGATPVWAGAHVRTGTARSEKADLSEPDRPPQTPRPLALLRTSGTTGDPRCALLGPDAFTASARATGRRLGWSRDDRWLLSLPLAHVGGLSILTRSLLARMTVVISREAPSFDPEELIRAIEREQVTFVSMVPTMLHRLLLHASTWRPRAHLRSVLLGGAPASDALLREARSHRIPVVVTYGLTEACSQVTATRPRSGPNSSLGAGEPLEGMEVRIVEGEIEVRSPSMMAGYLSSQGLVHPFLDGGWFPTGDTGRVDEEGRLHVSGRKRDRIVTGGENVSPREVEAVLERFPGIRAACVFGVPDETWGETVAAAILSAPETEIELAALGAFVSRELAPHERPRHVCVLDPSVETFENARGKLDRRQIASGLRGRLERLPRP